MAPAELYNAMAEASPRVYEAPLRKSVTARDLPPLCSAGVVDLADVAFAGRKRAENVKGCHVT